MKPYTLFCIIGGILAAFILNVAPGAMAKDAADVETFLIDEAGVADLALTNSLDIQIARFDASIKRTELMEAESVFDTFLNAQAGYSDDQKDVASAFLGTKNTESEYSFGIEKKLPTGTTVNFTAGNVRTHTDSSFSTVNPSHEATISATLTQNLGKNFFGIADRGLIRMTKLDIENTEYTSLTDIEAALFEVLRAYWNLVLKKESLRIRIEMRQQADRLYKIYENKLGMGMVEEVDMAEIRGHLRRLDVGVLNAGLDLVMAKNDLLFLLNVNNLRVELEPMDELDINPESVDLYNSLQVAVAARRDYRKMRNELEKNNVDLAVKKNALWPEIDLEASLTKNGIDSEYHNAWEKTTDADYRQFYVGLQVKLPLENRKARAQKKAVQLKKEQLLLSLKRIERLILRELNNQVTRVNTLKNEVELTREIVELQKVKLAQEHKRLEWGRSNADVMVRYEDDVLQAMLDEARALYTYRIGVLELARRQNILLDYYWKEGL